MITNGSADSSQLIYARIAGVTYILVILIGVLSGALVDLQLIVKGDVGVSPATPRHHGSQFYLRT